MSSLVCLVQPDSISLEIQMLKKQTEELNNKYVANNQIKSDLEKKHSDLAIEEEHLAKKLELYEGFYATAPLNLQPVTPEEPKTPVGIFSQQTGSDDQDQLRS